MAPALSGAQLPAIDGRRRNMAKGATDTTDKVRGWDPLVKLTHWGIALAVLVNGVFTEEGSGWHVWVGTGMAALLAVRLLWGFIGPREARFSAFPPSPVRAIAHVGDIFGGRKVPHASHNGLGALMAYALWATLGVVAITGFAMSGVPGTASARVEAPVVPSLTAPLAPVVVEADEEEDEGEEGDDGGRAGAVGERGEGVEGSGRGEGPEWIEEVHEVAANLLYVLAALHIGGVLFESWRTGPAVVRRMTGGVRG
jgi:cytochrome b